LEEDIEEDYETGYGAGGPPGMDDSSDDDGSVEEPVYVAGDRYAEAEGAESSEEQVEAQRSPAAASGASDIASYGGAEGAPTNFGAATSTTAGGETNGQYLSPSKRPRGAQGYEQSPDRAANRGASPRSRGGPASRVHDWQKEVLMAIFEDENNSNTSHILHLLTSNGMTIDYLLDQEGEQLCSYVF
jgi:hypothetical protein